METDHHDICRVCRSEGSQERPLFHPCVCMGSIKYIHQDCLLQWLKYSRKEYCELCKHRFSFTPIYSPDMPKRLPIKVLVMGLLRSVARAVRYWLHYTLVAFAWLGIVPLTACRIYRCLFTGSVSSLLTLPLDMLSTDNLASDCFQGCLVVTCTLCAFIGLVWLREQILQGGGPDWLEQDNAHGNQGMAAGGGLLAWAQGNNRNRGGANNDQPAPAAAQPAQPDDAGDVNEVINDESDHEDGPPEGVGDQEQQANEQNNAAQDDINWNPVEWDRAAEELTWERLLGLDGSLVFLEHVFWVVSLNTLFILVFAFCPYHIGQFTVAGLKMEKLIAASHFEGLMTTLIGYIIIDVSLVNLHFLVSLAKLLRPKRILGLCHIVVKVSLLVVVEVGVFPLICGWWLDVCSLSMFDSSIKDREQSFNMAPGTCMFIHWLVGMVYVFYFASFILLLREVLRPGVLWFLRNLNDPDFNPIQEMIHLPILRHIRRFVASIVIFGSVVLLMLWAPVQVIRKVLPTFLPYNVMLNSDAPVSELSLELLLLQVVLPALLEQGHTRSWLKGLVKGWTIGVACILNIRSYLLGDVTITDTDEDETVVGADEPQQAPHNAPPADPPADAQQEGVGAIHQAMLQGGGPTGFQPYKRPRFFPVRVIGLIVLIGVTLFVASMVCLVLPVWIGRQLMMLWMKGVKIHELYTAACGLYTCWLVLRAVGVLYDWLPQGWRPIVMRLTEWLVLGLKAGVAMMLLLGVIPLMLGVLFELVVVVPLRVPLDQSPVFFPWQDWALGVLHAKIICAITMMGPQWWLKRNMEQVYNMGLRNLNLSFILHQLCIPVIGTLGVALALPYAVVRSVVKVTGIGFDTENLVLRRIYPLLLTVVILIGLCVFHTRQFKRLYEHIKNDRYLVGQRLVNYERETPPSEGVPSM